MREGVQGVGDQARITVALLPDDISCFRPSFPRAEAYKNVCQPAGITSYARFGIFFQLALGLGIA